MLEHSSDATRHIPPPKPPVRRRLRHPNGRDLHSVSLSKESGAYVEELADRLCLTFSTVLGMLVHHWATEHEDPPRHLPFDLTGS